MPAKRLIQPVYEHRVAVNTSDVLIIMNHDPNPINSVERLYASLLDRWVVIDTTELGFAAIITSATLSNGKINYESPNMTGVIESVESDKVREL